MRCDPRASLLAHNLASPYLNREPKARVGTKVLDGTPIACGLGIGKGLDVMFRVSVRLAIMSLVFSFKF
jgi:hypothetical protein